MREIDLEKVQSDLEQLVDQAAGGDSFVITVNGKPEAMATPIQMNSPQEEIPPASA